MISTEPQLYDGTLVHAFILAEYFFHIAKLNQLLVLSQQLEEDIRHLGSHKYIAHQLSVIYVRHTKQNATVNQAILFPLVPL